MKKVVLFKTASDEYREAFAEHNYSVAFVEPLRFALVNLEQLSHKLSQQYSGLVVTSPRAVDALAAVWRPALLAQWGPRAVWAVGAATATALRLLGLHAAGAAAGSAAQLARDIIRATAGDHATFLFPCGSLSSDALTDVLHSNDISVDRLTVYETMENENLQTELMELDRGESELCAMVFFSPSGCEFIHRRLQTFSNRLALLPHFAIGNTTAHKIENLGLEIAGVAAEPKANSVLECVQNYLTATV